MKNTELDFDWSALPKWVNWIAMDSTGFWYCYQDEPEHDSDYPIWIGSKGSIDIPIEYYPKNFTGDWKESLFEVPKIQPK